MLSLKARKDLIIGMVKDLGEFAVRFDEPDEEEAATYDEAMTIANEVNALVEEYEEIIAMCASIAKDPAECLHAPCSVHRLTDYLKRRIPEIYETSSN